MSTKVFIASTCFDLIDVRAELEKEIRDLGLVPLLSDSKLSDFDYGDEAVGRNSIDLCRHNLKSCQYVIFVLSQRYGSDLERYEYPGISATHLEYRTAQEHNKETTDEKMKLKILVFVRDRTIVDYDRWRKDNHIDKKFLLYAKDDKLFAFLDEHAKIHAADKDRTNWVTEFTSTLDLKQAVRKQLDKEALEAELSKLMRSGIEIPTFAFNFDSDHLTMPESTYLGRDKYHHHTFGCNYIALNMRITGSQHVPHSVQVLTVPHVNLHAFLIDNEIQQQFLRSIDNKHYRLILGDRDPNRNKVSEQQGCKREIDLAVQFTMSNGYILRDHWRITISYTRLDQALHFLCEHLGKQLVEKGKIYSPSPDKNLT